MEARTFVTHVKKGARPWRDDNCDFVVGRVSGMKTAICDFDNKPDYADYYGPDGVLLITKCTQEQYDKFTEIVEKNYPGLCDFDYKRGESR